MSTSISSDASNVQKQFIDVVHRKTAIHITHTWNSFYYNLHNKMRWNHFL